MPVLANLDNCCGCSACANKCAKGAISMIPNVEGFLHPVVDTVKCVECGLCEKVCPALDPAVSISDFSPFALVLQHKDDNIRYQSTSGGAFTAIAEKVIEKGGVVFGAAFSSGLKVRHIGVSTKEELLKFRNSKYVQSEIGVCYKLARKYLMEGKMVCFSGTPCQINGLYKFLGRDYENLITVDIVCKSVPSPMVFQKYVEYKMEQEGEISDIVFRDKKRGFLYCTMAHYITHEDKMAAKSSYRRGSESDEWLRLFLSGKISRRSCTSCKYQSMNRPGDFTLGDIWETGNTNFDDNKGSTMVHVWTAKGKLFLESISDSVRMLEYPIEQSRGTTRNNAIKIRTDRGKLFKDANTLTPQVFFKKYAPYNIRIRMKNVIRYILWLLNLQTTIRHIKHLIIHRNK